jgi:cytochrome c
LVWNEAALANWITNPRLMIQGTKMTFAGVPNPADRADLIAFLKAAP